MPASTQHFGGVNPIIKTITDTLSEASKEDADKGDPRVAGDIDWNPEAVEHVLGTFVGGAGKFVGRTLNVASKLVTGDPIHIKETPWARRFYGAGFYEGQDRQLVYNIRAEAKRAHDSMMDGTRAPADPELQAMGWPHKAYIQAYNVSRLLTKVKEDRDALSARRDITEADKLAGLEDMDVYERNLMHNFLETYFTELRPLLKKRRIPLPDKVKRK